MPRTGLSSEELKEKAVDVTEARIRLVGYDKVRLSDVARDIGVSHAALYPHFADKAALLDAVIMRFMHSLEATVAAVASSGVEPKERVVEWLVTLYKTKRARALADPEPNRAFNLAAGVTKPFVIAHLKSLHGQLAGLLAELLPGTKAEEVTKNARLLYSATAAYHHPTLVTQWAAEDREQDLRDITLYFLTGMLSPHPG